MTEPAGSIRIITPNMEDLPRLLEIERASFTHPWTEDLLAGELKPKGHNHALAAYEPRNETIVGYCFFWMFAETEGHILNLAVDPKWRRRGVADALV